MGSAERSLASYTALAYDIIGTLIDYETGVLAFLTQRLDAVGKCCPDNLVLEAYARAEQKQQGLHPDTNSIDIFSLAWPQICEEIGLPVSEPPTEEYKRSVLDWQPFPDSKEALAYLKQHYLMFPITTGSTPATKQFAAKLGDPFHQIYTADMLGFGKPDVRAFESALKQVHEKSGIDKKDVLLVAQSQFHDIVPSEKVGLDTAWIERRHDKEGLGGTPIPPEGLATPTYHFHSMAEFAAAVKQSRGDS